MMVAQSADRFVFEHLGVDGGHRLARRVAVDRQLLALGLKPGGAAKRRGRRLQRGGGGAALSGCATPVPISIAGNASCALAGSAESAKRERRRGRSRVRCSDGHDSAFLGRREGAIFMGAQKRDAVPPSSPRNFDLIRRARRCARSAHVSVRRRGAAPLRRVGSMRAACSRFEMIDVNSFA